MGVPKPVDTLGQWGRADLSMQRRLQEGRLLDRGGDTNGGRDVLTYIRDDGNGGRELVISNPHQVFPLTKEVATGMAKQLLSWLLRGDKLYL